MINLITIFTGSTDEGIKRFKKYFEAISSKDKAVYARIRYDSINSPEFYSHPINYPVVIYTTDNLAFCLGDVTAGYGGTGPHGTIEILKYLGFEFDKQDILRKRDLVNLNILKGNARIKENFYGYSIMPFDYLNTPFKNNIF